MSNQRQFFTDEDLIRLYTVSLSMQNEAKLFRETMKSHGIMSLLV